MAGFEDDDVPFDNPTPPKRPGKATTTQPDPDKPAVAKSATTAPAEIESENLVALVDDSPLVVLQDEGKRTALYAKIRALIADQKPDLSTQAGRDRVKSFAFKIVRTRTALDAAGKEATAHLRVEIDGVNELRRTAIASLELLEAEARKPLTEWEEAQAKAANDRKLILQQMSRAAGALHLAAPDLKDLQVDIEALTFDPELWGEQLDMVTARQAEVVQILDDRIRAIEADQRARKAEQEAEALRAAAASTGPATADENAPHAAPVIERRELPPVGNGAGAPAGEGPAKVLTPTQQARRLVLPVLIHLGVHEDAARAVILAIEKNEVPGIVAAYLEKTP